MEVLSLGVKHIPYMLSFCALFLGMVAPDRTLFFLSGVPNLIVASFLFAFAALIMFIFVKPRFLNARNCSLKQIMQKLAPYAPILIFCAFNIIFVAIAYLNLNIIGEGSSLRPLRWWVDFFMLQISILCALYIGAKTARCGNRTLGTVMFIALCVMAVLSVGEYYYLSGYANQVGQWIRAINLDSPVHVWIWQDFEPVRAQGLARSPSLYAFTALIFVVWALSAKKMLLLRYSGLVIAIMIVYLSGTRSAFVALAFVLLVYLLKRVTDGGFISQLRNQIRYLIPAAAILLILVGGTYYVTGMNNISRNVAIAEVLNSGDGELAEEQELAVYQISADYETDTMIQEPSYSFWYQISSGRTEVWRETITQIKNHPWGMWVTSDSAISWSHTHNDILERLITAGVVSLFLYLLLLWWLAFRVKSYQAPLFPLLLSALLLSFGLFEVVFAQIAFAPPAFYLLGYLSNPDGGTCTSGGQVQSEQQSVVHLDKT